MKIMSRDEYVRRFISKFFRVYSGLNKKEVETHAFNNWNLHSKEKYKHFEYPEKDAEIEALWTTHPKD